jgi:PAS domain S-box-containing protein/putative nucleotidyltransferase with HDIG domain
MWLNTKLIPIKDDKQKVFYVMSVSRDITHHKVSQHYLESYKNIFDYTGTAIVVVEQDTTIIMANTEAENLSGYTKDELEGKMKWTQLVIPEDRQKMMMYNKTRPANPKKVPPKYEFRFKTKNNRIKTVYAMISIDPLTKERIVSMMDITEQKMLEHNLMDSEHFVNSLFTSITDGISVLDRELNIIRVNPTMEKWYPQSVPLIGKKCYKAYHCATKKCKICPSIKVINTGKPANEIVPKRGPAGEVIGWLSIYSYPFIDISTKKLTGVIEYVRDITSHKIAEESLELSEHRYKELWDNAPVAYHTLNKNGIITSVNQTELTMLGYSREQMIGKSIFDFVEQDQREEAEKRFHRKISGKETPKAKSRLYQCSDGSKIFVSVDDMLEHDKHGRITGIRTTMVNITKQKEIEEELKQSLEKLQRTMDNSMRMIAKIVEQKDPYTAGHQLRVANFACAIAKELNLTSDEIERIRIAGLLHDIGKINVPIEILSKPGKISEIEMNIIKLHPKFGYDILKEIDLPYPIAEIVLQHHERISGDGYPQKLPESKILFEAKILGVADTVEAMSSHRPYRPAVGIKDAIKEVSKNRGRFYDPGVADACITLLKTKRFKFEKHI